MFTTDKRSWIFYFCAIQPPHKAHRNSIFIFDDIAGDKQDSVKEYFAMGRHSHINSFYLCQSYASIPKHFIRDNANLIILFKQDNANLKHIYNNHVNTDMTFEKFLDLCAICWQDPYNFVVIDKDSPINKGRYRKGFNDFTVL